MWGRGCVKGCQGSLPSSGGTVYRKLAFDDMAWAKRMLKGPDPTVDFIVNPNVKQLLKPGDVIEIGVKKLTKEGCF